MNLNIQVGVNGTDHMGFFCAECGCGMEVTKVKTKTLKPNVPDPSKNADCTWIYLKCKCGATGCRKFYWKQWGIKLPYRTLNLEKSCSDHSYTPRELMMAHWMAVGLQLHARN